MMLFAMMTESVSAAPILNDQPHDLETAQFFMGPGFGYPALPILPVPLAAAAYSHGLYGNIIDYLILTTIL